MPASFIKTVEEHRAQGHLLVLMREDESAFGRMVGEYGVCTHLPVLAREKESKQWCLPVPLSLERVPTGSCPSRDAL